MLIPSLMHRRKTAPIMCNSAAHFPEQDICNCLYLYCFTLTLSVHMGSILHMVQDYG